MGRYSAPLFDHDHDDGDDCQAMDWTPIPDDGHADAGDNIVANGRDVGVGSGVGDSRSNTCYSTASSTNHVNGHGCSDGFSNSRRGEGRPRAGNSTDITFFRQENDFQDATNNCVLRAAERYLELQSDLDWEHQQSQKKRKRIRTTMIVVVAIVAVVLKRHAPPPPPLWSQSPSVATSFFGDSGIMNNSGFNPSIDDNVRGMTQHETWASYSRHFLQLVHHALAYAASVAWYAISNSFRYAVEELRDISVEFWDGNGNDDDKSVWLKWKRKLISICTTLSQLQKAKGSQSNSQAMNDIKHDNECALSKISLCPIRLPSAHNHLTHLPRGDTTHDITNDGSIIEDWSSEEFLRQTIGTSLSPQNLALRVISEGIDSWGEALVGEAPVSLVHKIATATSTSPKQKCVDDETLAGWILPPAAGFLLVGPEGVGKLHTSRRIADLFWGHCSGGSPVRADLNIPMQELDGVLEVIAGNHAKHDNEVHPARELIVDHIHSRKGLGSAIIIHHIELLPTSLLSDISQVLSGTTDLLSYQNPEKLVEVSCEGTVFILTAKEWGTKSIFQYIQRNYSVKGMRRESLLSSIRSEVDSHLDYRTKLAAHATTAPFFPFAIEDLSSILQHKIQTLNRKYQGLYWKQLEVSHATIKHAVGIDHVEYLDLYKQGNGSEVEEQNVSSLLTYSTSGAYALDNNALWQTLRMKLLTASSRRPGHILKVDLDDDSRETVFTWCNRENGDIESCEEEWRSLLT